MVVGIGVDIVAVGRLEKALERRPRLEARLFTARERADAGPGPVRVKRLAARFAAKEALLKALGTGLGDASWQEVSVMRLADGPPRLVLTGRILERARRLGVVRSHLSLSHEGAYALAQVVLEG